MAFEKAAAYLKTKIASSFPLYFKYAAAFSNAMSSLSFNKILFPAATLGAAP